MSDDETLKNNQEVVPFQFEVIEDEKGLGRFVYELNDGTRIFIKDPSEIPSIKLEGNSFVLTPEEVPPGGNQEDYDTWIRTNTSGEIDESSNIIVNNTVLGALDLAMLLIKKGEQNPESAQSIIELREKISEDKVDEQVLELFDKYLAAGFVSEKLIYSYDGLMLLAMSLCGDEKATSEIRQREINLEEYAEQFESGLEPGTKLNREQLEKIANEHLVAVHTTYTEADGDSFALQSLSTHRRDSIRSTLHWSLNHAVVSHISGDFKGRDTTVVSRLESLARDNGSPAVIYGVDTYFTMDPKEELIISKDLDESLVISFVESGKDSNPFSYKGNTLIINKDRLEGDGLKSILDEIALENFDPQYKLASLIDSIVRESSNSEITEKDNPLQILVKKKCQSEGIESRQASEEIIESILNGTIKLDDYPSRIYEDIEYNISYRVASLRDQIQEFVRKLIVDSTITRFGGNIVKSDGTSAYIETTGFDERVGRLASDLGIRMGLHAYQSENRLEDSPPYSKNGDFEYVKALMSNKKARRHLSRNGTSVEKAPIKYKIDEDKTGA